MTDPYNVPAGQDPQSLAIERQIARRNGKDQAQTYDTFARRKRKGGGCLSHLQSAPDPIQRWLEEYDRLDESTEPQRRMEGTQQVFETAQVYAGLWAACGRRLRFNLLSDEVELNGSPVANKEEAAMHLGVSGWRHGRLPSFEEVEVFARCNAHSPVATYLRSLPAADGDPHDTLQDVGRCALGVTDELALRMVAQTLIGAVARALQPGCEQQTCLVLQGPQGAGKTTFFKALFGQEFFGHLDTSRDQRDWAMAMHSRWCVELGELEAFTSKKSAGMLKSFLSSSYDTYRRPYDRTTRTVKRHSVCVGTVNVGTPLVDETGNRRYWVVPVGERVDLDWVRANRDRVWAAALALYDADVPWWFEREEEARVMVRAEEYRETHPWEELLGELLPALADGPHAAVSERVRGLLFHHDHTAPLTSSVLLAMLGVDTGHQNRTHARQLGAIMRPLGWDLRKKVRDGVARKEWFPAGSPC